RRRIDCFIDDRRTAFKRQYQTLGASGPGRFKADLATPGVDSKSILTQWRQVGCTTGCGNKKLPVRQGYARQIRRIRAPIDTELAPELLLAQFYFGNRRGLLHFIN